MMLPEEVIGIMWSLKWVGNSLYSTVTHLETSADISMSNTKKKVTQQWLWVASQTEANIDITSGNGEVGWHNESHIYPKDYVTVPNTASLWKKQGTF